jgi:KTSC domain
MPEPDYLEGVRRCARGVVAALWRYGTTRQGPWEPLQMRWPRMAEFFHVHGLVGRFFTRSRVPESSVIGRLDYNWLTRTLRITFKHGEVYAYRGVPGRVARELEKASDCGLSVGHVFNANVRDQFRFERAA